MTLGFSSLREGKLFLRALAKRKLVFQLVDLVKQSRRKICEDMRVLAMMCIGKWWAVWFSRNFSLLTGKCKDSLC
jgi:hypothetical protein